MRRLCIGKRWWSAWAIAVLTSACAGKQFGVFPSADASTTVGHATITPSVNILAIGGTEQLSVSVVSQTGAPITTFDSVKYVLSALADTLRIRATAQGLVTAVAGTATPALVNVFVFQNGGVVADQALIQVTSTAVPGVTLSIQPTGTDSAKLAMGVTKTIVPVLRNATTGASVASPAIKYSVKATDVTKLAVYTPQLKIPVLSGINATVQNSLATPVGVNQIMPLVGEGTVWIYGAVNAYGTLLQDSTLYQLSYPYTYTIGTFVQAEAGIGFVSANAYAAATLASGATVTFSFRNLITNNNVTATYSFDNPAAATVATPPATVGGISGNVTTLTNGQTSARRFLVPGTYRWTAVATGVAPWGGQTVTGTIVIR